MSTRVLVAETDRTAGELISTVLTRDGFVVTLSRDGEQATAELEGETVGLFICGADLTPEGPTALAELAKKNHPECRVVLLVGSSDDQTAIASLQERGACELLLLRPFRYPRLKEALTEWGFLDSKPQAESEEKHLSFELPPVAPPSVDAIEPVGLAPAPLEAATLEAPASSEAPRGSNLPELDLDDLIGGPPPPSLPTVPIELAAPKAPVAGGIAAEGDVAAHPLGRLLFELYINTFTGTLRLRRLGMRRIVYIDGGLPIHVESDQMAESLGRLLIEHGRITQEQYSEAQDLVVARNCRFGEALTELGFLGRGDLLDALMEQTEIKLANSFAWRDAKYELEALPEPPHHVVATEVHPLKAIWRGVSENYDAAALSSYFAPLRERFAVATDLFAVHFDTLGPFLRHLELPTLLDGRRTFAEILEDAPEDKKKARAQALYVLLTADMVHPESKPGSAAILPREPLGVAAAPAAASANLAALTHIAEEIAREYLRIKEGDFFDALRVDVDATAEEVDAAYTHASRPWRLQDLPPDLPEETLSRVREVGELLARARNTLRDATLRERYLAAQRERYSAAPAATIAGAPPAAPMRPVFGNIELDTDAARRQESLQAQRAFEDGQALFAAGNLPGAESKFREAVQQNELEPDYWAGLAQVSLTRLEAGEAAARESAVTSLQQAFQLDPAHLGANLGMAKLLVAVGQPTRAQPYLERVLQRAPEHQEARRLLAACT